jgi:hypothetical protein
VHQVSSTRETAPFLGVNWKKRYLQILKKQRFILKEYLKYKIIFDSLIDCGWHYADSWCEIQGNPDKLYYGRGWFQLSWPCNYYAAGNALRVDLLNNPDLLEQEQDLAAKAAIWFYKSNRMDGPARLGDFAATTRIINGNLECDGGPSAANQHQRVESYRRIRQCFGLGEPAIYPTC